MTQRLTNRTRRANPDQLALSSEYRGWVKRTRHDPTSGNPSPPEFEGVCTLNGDSYWISGWVNRKGAKPTLDLVFQLAVRGSTPYRFKPEDIRLKTQKREKPTQEGLDWSHYVQAPPEHRESEACPRCVRVRQRLDRKYGATAPW